MLNISTAAFHLNYLFKGHIDFATVEDVLSVLEPGSCNGIKQVPVGNFKNPLHVALSLSPILLFVQVTIQSKSMGRPRLMEVRPPHLLLFHVSANSQGLESGWTPKASGHKESRRNGLGHAVPHCWW
ncbi:hypothetical protein BDN72DRAFT_851661 [Pluteus cervinus]|uniref:Uncharacterized protein n=1 Tax=Pluteus cervinus TaxID=181527 RepID=A0ACD2ZZQ8_9AGAR|nr:hypothetical protein BDN72DRAFT_851661 [Pluteus cervinus]